MPSPVFSLAYQRGYAKPFELPIARLKLELSHDDAKIS